MKIISESVFQLRICFQRVRPVGQLGGCCSSRGLHCFIWHACGKWLLIVTREGEISTNTSLFIFFNALLPIILLRFGRLIGKRSILEGSAECNWWLTAEK